MERTKRMQLQEIHDKSMQILETVGMRFLHPEARRILKEHGIRVEGEIAYFTEDQLMYWVRKAPSTFKVKARNPKYDVIIGGDRTEPAPPYGAPNITEMDGTKRNATIEDYINYAKLFEANYDFNINGGLMVQPSDVAPATSSLAMFYAAATHSEKTQLVVAGAKNVVHALMEGAKAIYGEENMRKDPYIITIVNVNSPLMLDLNMTDTLIEFASNGQPFVIANCSMAGSTSPVTLAGTIALMNAEILPVIALAQMINPGTPVMYATQTTTADMATGQIAIGSPEGALCYKYCAQLAKFYELPCRGGGALTDSKIVDAQSGYESMATLMTDYLQHMNFVIHAAGILDGFSSTSYAKVIQDFEINRYIKRFMKDITINEDTIPMELIEEIGHDGEYLTEDHTFEWCRKEPFLPMISTRGPVADPQAQLNKRITEQYNKLMDAYKQPELDRAAFDKAKQIFIEAGVDAAVLDKIDTL